MKYAILNEKITERGIDRNTIAALIGVSERTLNKKIAGKSPFTWAEACKIQRTFFPDIDSDHLFS